jgi:hypothetical protein
LPAHIKRKVPPNNYIIVGQRPKPGQASQMKLI